MIKMLYYPLIVLMLLFSTILGSIIHFRSADAPLLYFSDFNKKDKFYSVLDVETGETLSFHRPPGFKGIQYYGEVMPPTREDFKSPYDETVRFVLLRDYEASTPEDQEQLYRARDVNRLELVVSGINIFIPDGGFTDNGRYVYLSKHNGQGNQSTLYRYDIQSAELDIVALNVTNINLNCQNDWCQVISGMSGGEDEAQTLFVLNPNSGELRKVAEADKFVKQFWWRQNELLYTPQQGSERAVIYTYNVETDQHRLLAEVEGQEIANIYDKPRANSSDNNQIEDWLMVVANSPENDSTFDLYIVNDFANKATVYPLGIQTSDARWLSRMTVPTGSLLLTTSSSPNDRSDNMYIIDNITGQPIVEELTNTDFGAMSLHDIRLEFNLGDTLLISMPVNDDEWAYYTIHVPTRTITRLAMFQKTQFVVESRLSVDKKWLAISFQEATKYYVVVMPTDGSQSPRRWDVGTESYVCLLAWYEPDVEPAPCNLYFGMG